LHYSRGGVRVSRLGASDDRYKNKHGKCVVRMDSDLEYHFDVEHRTETCLVDHSVHNPGGQHRHLRHTLDGDCGGSQQA